MNSTSPDWRFVRIAARSPARSRTGPEVDLIEHAQLVGDDVRQRRLPEPRGTAEQDMVQRLAAGLRRLDEHGQVVLDPFLAHEVFEPRRPEAPVELGVLLGSRWGSTMSLRAGTADTLAGKEMLSARRMSAFEASRRLRGPRARPPAPRPWRR